MHIILKKITKKGALDPQPHVILYQLLAHGRWFSPGTPASSTTKNGHHDIVEILMKVALKHKISNQIKSNQIDNLFPLVSFLLFLFFLNIFSKH